MRRSFAGLELRGAAVGALAGLAVAAAWIAPEFSPFYRKWLCLGTDPASGAPSPYSPEVCGWFLTLARLAGSAFVIAPAEELFFRSYLYRRLQSANFTAVPLSRFDAQAFLWTVFLFTLEHDRPVVAALAGAAYGLLAVKAGIWPAIMAHAVTNFALGAYVVLAKAWAFW